ncbi:MAG: hypothetical protein R3Y56_01385 [Akkermansia sp.]
MQPQSFTHLLSSTLALLLVLLLSVVKLCPCTENTCVPDASCAPLSTSYCACSHHAGTDEPAPDEHEHSCSHETMPLVSVIPLLKLPLAVVDDVFVAISIKMMILNHDALAIISESLDPPPLLRSPFVAALKPLLI